MEEKITKEEKRKDWEKIIAKLKKIIAKLKSMPPEKLSKAAKWVLKEEEKGDEYWLDMKAVLK